MKELATGFGIAVTLTIINIAIAKPCGPPIWAHGPTCPFSGSSSWEVLHSSLSWTSDPVFCPRTIVSATKPIIP